MVLYLIQYSLQVPIKSNGCVVSLCLLSPSFTNMNASVPPLHE